MAPPGLSLHLTFAGRLRRLAPAGELKRSTELTEAAARLSGAH
jgi:hypothetical protein